MWKHKWKILITEVWKFEIAKYSKKLESKIGWWGIHTWHKGTHISKTGDMESQIWKLFYCFPSYLSFLPPPFQWHSLWLDHRQLQILLHKYLMIHLDIFDYTDILLISGPFDNIYWSCFSICFICVFCGKSYYSLTLMTLVVPWVLSLCSTFVHSTIFS
jgi:hypothetical protein